MSIEIVIVVGLVLMLAWVNGANDISKGIATLVGNGTTHARRAIWWGTLWTIAGGLVAIVWGSAVLKTFSNGYISTGFTVDIVFIASVLIGAAGWVTGALMGVRWANKQKPSQVDALKLVLYGWVVTFPIAAGLSASGSWLMGSM